MARNAVNSEVIFRSTKERVHELMSSPLPDDPLELLARTQALILYQLMWVFSPDPRAVDSAEETRPAAADAARALLRHIYFEEALDCSGDGFASSYSLHNLLPEPPNHHPATQQPEGTTLFQQQPEGMASLFRRQQQQPTTTHGFLAPAPPQPLLSTAGATNNITTTTNNNNNDIIDHSHSTNASSNHMHRSLSSHHLTTTTATADEEDAAWRAWIFQESARRTFLCLYYWSLTWDKITGRTCPEAARLARRHRSFTMAACLWHARDGRGFAAAWAEGRRFMVVDEE
jgi:hypothetical protein